MSAGAWAETPVAGEDAAIIEPASNVTATSEGAAPLSGADTDPAQIEANADQDAATLPADSAVTQPTDPIGRFLAEQTDQRAGNVDLAVAEFYLSRDFAPVWVSEAGLNDAGNELFATLADAASDGLHPDDYLHDPVFSRIGATDPAVLAELDIHLTDAFLNYGGDLMNGRFRQREANATTRTFESETDLIQPLRYAADSGLIEQTLRGLAPPHEQYHALRQALSDYRQLAAAGGWQPVPDTGSSLEQGARGSAVSALRARLTVSGDYVPPADGVADDTYYDAGLADAVKAFQLRHGLLDDAVVGPRTLSALNASAEYRVRQLEASMERWRWYPRDLGVKHVMVNVPQFMVRAVNGDNEPVVMRVVVGTRDNQTPVFNDSMEYAQLNPYWNVPQSIADGEYLPALRNDPFYLLNQNIRILSGGREINPVLVDWSSMSGRFPYSLRQEPGGGNALGRIKFMFPNGHAVYMHDTPSRSLFQRTTRSFSHGCIRLQDPMAMAGFVFEGRYTAEEVEAMIAGGRTRDIILDQHIPVYVAYFTSIVDDDGNVGFFRDIYDRDAALLQAMNDSVPEPPTQIAEIETHQGLN